MSARHDYDDKTLSPLKRIRLFCLDCMGGSPGLVRECRDLSCPFFLYRMGRAERDEREPEAPEHGRDEAVAPARPLRVIRRCCMRCAHNDRKAVRECGARETCALWLCRFGVRPRTVEKMRARRRRPKELTLPGLEGFSPRRK